MVLILLLVEPGQSFIQLRFIRIILDPAFEEILAERKIFTLGLNSQGETRLSRILHCRHAGIPSHMPRCRVPKQERVRLQSGDLSKQKKDPTPFCSLPSHVRLNEKNVCHCRTKSAQGGDKPELAEFFPEIQIEFNSLKAFLSMLGKYCPLGRQFHHAEDEDH